MIKKYLFFLFIIAATPIFASASTIYIVPENGKFACGETVVTKISATLDNDECINAGEISIKFPSNLIRVENFSSANSIFSLWVNRPSGNDFDKINRYGVLTFSGGIPNGYCDSGNDEIVLGRVIFRVNTPCNFTDLKKTEIEFMENTRLLLNDGAGTATDILKSGAHYDIKPTNSTSSNLWAAQLDKDKTPPEVFTIGAASTPNIFNGQLFITFNTQDNQTGIDHYEVAESGTNKGAKTLMSRLRETYLPKKDELPIAWMRAESPYLLKDQSLSGLVKVKAVDKAGNERISTLIPPTSANKFKASFFIDNTIDHEQQNSIIALIAALISLVILIILLQLINIHKVTKQQKKKISKAGKIEVRFQAKPIKAKK